MLKAEVQTIILRPVHHSEVQAVGIIAVAVSLGLVPDAPQVRESFFPQGGRLIGQGNGLVAHSPGRVIELPPVAKILCRIEIHIAEYFILLVPDLMDSLQEGPLLRQNRPERETVNPGSS